MIPKITRMNFVKSEINGGTNLVILDEGSNMLHRTPKVVSDLQAVDLEFGPLSKSNSAKGCFCRRDMPTLIRSGLLTSDKRTGPEYLPAPQVNQMLMPCEQILMKLEGNHESSI